MDLIQQNSYTTVISAGFSKRLALQDKSQQLLLEATKTTLL
jgi:hypothetical protein